MISVILPTRNRSSILPAAIEALDRASRGHDVEILVIDNGSTDDTRRIVAGLSPISASLTYLEEPVAGVCRAKNVGVRRARGEILVFTDDDCRVSESYFDDLVRHYAGDTGPVIRGGRVELGDPTDAPITIKLENEPAVLGGDQHPGGFVHGCNLTMSRSVAEAVGPWDEQFGPGAQFVAGEDTEMIYRAHKRGIPVHYVPDMSTSHHHGRKTLADVKKLNDQYQVGNGALIGKHPDKLMAKHLFWNAKGWVREMTGGARFSEELGLSYRDIVVGQAAGAFRYWMSKVSARPT